MNQIRSGPRRRVTILGALAILVGACNSSASPSPSAPGASSAGRRVP